ncbi:hypothetical protein [Shouchella lehensis]|nr:hypothetical protein [Shouchella lehensis]
MLGIIKLLLEPNPLFYIPSFGLAVCFLFLGLLDPKKTKNTN